MDFITGFPRISRQNDFIIIVVDQLTKVSHSIPMNSTHSDCEVAQVFIREIMRLPSIPNNIGSYRDTMFTTRLWKELFACLGIELEFITNYHL